MAISYPLKLLHPECASFDKNHLEMSEGGTCRDGASGLRDMTAREGLGSEDGGYRTGSQLWAWLSLGQAKGKTCIPRAGENCQSQLPSSLQQKAHGQQQRVAPLTASLELPHLTSKDQIQRLQERGPDPPFSLPELKPKECPCPASQPHFETEQDVFLIKDTWEAFALRSFPGLSLILTMNLQKGSPMLLTTLQCQHVRVATGPA